MLTARKKLTAYMEINLSQQITSEGDLRDLGTRGFGFAHNTIDTALRNKRDDINQAGLVIIKKWSTNHTDKAEAYDLLCAILDKIKRASWKNVLIDELVE